MIIVNGWKPLTIITKSSILDVAAVLDPPLGLRSKFLVGQLSRGVLNSSCYKNFAKKTERQSTSLLKICMVSVKSPFYGHCSSIVKKRLGNELSNTLETALLKLLLKIRKKAEIKGKISYNQLC